MKIVKIEIIPVTIPFTQTLKTAIGDWDTAEFVIVRMHTDAGLIGIGEVPPWIAVSRISQGSIVNIIQKHIAPVILGLDPFQIEKAWHLMDLHAPGNAMAATPIDMAMYDLMGKILKTPVYNLLGGLYRDKVPIAGIVGFAPLEEMVKECKSWVDDLGAKSVRFKTGLGLKQDMANGESDPQGHRRRRDPPGGLQPGLHAQGSHPRIEPPRRIRHRTRRTAGRLV